MGEGEQVEIADEFLERRRLAVEREGLFTPPDGDPQGPLQGAALDDPLDAAFRPAVPDAVPWGGGAEAAPVGQEIDRLQDVGLPLAVFAPKQGGAGAQGDVQFPDVAKIVEPQPGDAHA